jgi:diguanylate cyclase (GGDEF)-like protein
VSQATTAVDLLGPPTEPAALSPATAAPRNHRLTRFIGAVVVAGATLLAWFLAQPGWLADASDHRLQLGLFIGLLVLCELRPVTVARAGAVDEIVASTTFAFAVLLTFGPTLAMLAQLGASLLGDLGRRKELRRIVFNAGQYWVAWGLAGLAFHAVAGHAHLSQSGDVTGRDLWAILAAAATYFVVNSGLVGVVVAIHSHLPVLRNVAATLAQEASSDWVLLALAPIVFVVAERSVMMLPLLLLPVFAVYRSATISIEKDYQASHDSLTDLPNRAAFNERLDDALRRSRRHRTRLAVALIDLDRFKEVNDTLGHQIGDALLRELSGRLAEGSTRTAIVSRFGGDEFAVLFDDIEGPGDAMARAWELVATLTDPFQVDDFRLEVEASVGIALYPEHGLDNDTLLQHADIAMYVAKDNHSAVELYDARKDQYSRRRLGLLGELRSSLDSDEVVLYFQPKLDLVTGEVQSVEALVRWSHPEEGMILPGDFVPLAERTGLIGPLTTFVIERAVIQARRWLDAGLDLPIAVNLSARTLYDTQFPDEVRALLDRWRLPARLLHVEITESSMMADPERARRILTALHGMGIRVVIDDFGTGYSSLAYLQELPVSEIKVDRSFVIGMVGNESDQIIVRSTIDLAHNLGLQVTAEGVESLAALGLLRRAGCNAAQGYFISRPVPAHQLEAWMAERRVLSLCDDNSPASQGNTAKGGTARPPRPAAPALPA